MSYGKIVIGKIDFDIQGIVLMNGEIHFNTKATPRLKHLRELPDHGKVPFAIYGMDGELVSVGSTDAHIFDEAKAIGLVLADIYMTLPIKIITEMV